MKNVIFGVLALAASASFASGFRCESEEGFKVKLYNQTKSGTRVPSKLIVSHENASPATLLVADGSEITKTNRLNTVRYTVDGSDMNLHQVILQIKFKEGQETIREGEVVEGQLILVDEEGSREVSDLACERYLKG